MSQKPTVFPGIGPEGNSRESHRSHQGNYSRPFGDDKKGTVFPGMENDREYNKRGASSQQREGKRKPLVGFLYSLSRTGFGEYWPLYQGPNTLGRSPKCDVVLREGTVSEEHAVIVIRMMKNPEKLDASISDERSSHGTMLNGESIPSTHPMECKNGDIIVVGESYQLYLILIDARSLGLTLAENFIDADAADLEYEGEDENMGRGNMRDADEFPPHFNAEQFREQPPTYDGTIGMDGGTDGPRKGGTRSW